MSQSVYGIDLAKHSFSIHGENQQGKMLMQEPFYDRQKPDGGDCMYIALKASAFSAFCVARQTRFAGSMYGPP